MESNGVAGSCTERVALIQGCKKNEHNPNIPRSDSLRRVAGIAIA